MTHDGPSAYSTLQARASSLRLALIGHRPRPMQLAAILLGGEPPTALTMDQRKAWLPDRPQRRADVMRRLAVQPLTNNTLMVAR